MTVPNAFDFLERINFYESLCNGEPSVYRDYEKAKENCCRLMPFVEKLREGYDLVMGDRFPEESKKALCHGVTNISAIPFSRL